MGNKTFDRGLPYCLSNILEQEVDNKISLLNSMHNNLLSLFSNLVIKRNIPKMFEFELGKNYNALSVLYLINT